MVFEKILARKLNLATRNFKLMTKSRPLTKFLFRKIIMVGIMPIFLVSCQTMALYEFESLDAPKVIIPPDVKTIGFVDRNLSFSIDTLSNYYKMNSLVIKDTNNYDKIRGINSYLGFSENVSGYYSLDSVAFTHLPNKYINGARDYTPMPWTQVDSICESTGSDILVSLEDLQIYNQYETFNNNGEEYWGITDIKFYVVWRIYDPLLKKFHDERAATDSLYSEVESFSYDKLIQEKLPTREEINAEVAYEVGKRYADLISPEWNTYLRKFFVAGHQDFTLAHYYLMNDDLNQAISLWERHTESENIKLAGRACHNLVMAYELQGDYRNANNWMKKAIATYRSMDKAPSEFKYVKEYFKELTLRTQNNYLLDKFFGIDEIE